MEIALRFRQSSDGLSLEHSHQCIQETFIFNTNIIAETRRIVAIERHQLSYPLRLRPTAFLQWLIAFLALVTEVSRFFKISDNNQPLMAALQGFNVTAQI